MAKKNIRKKTVMVKAGNHLVDPTDVACITKIKNKGLYVVRLKSQPNMEYPIWVQKGELEALLEHFEIHLKDVPEAEGE